MPTSLTDAELAIVEAARATEPSLTAVEIGSRRDTAGRWIWDNFVIIHVASRMGLDAVEVDDDLITAFAADREPADGREHFIALTPETRIALSLRESRRIERARAISA